MHNYKIQLQDAGNGDAFLKIPDEVLELMNLKEGDGFKIEVSDGTLTLLPLKQNDPFLELSLAAKIIIRYLSKNEFNIERKLSGGKTLIEKIKEGELAVETVKELITLFEKEKAQRLMISERLGERNNVEIDLTDVGTPNPNEN